MKKIKKSLAVLAAFLGIIGYSFFLQKNSEIIANVSDTEGDALNSQTLNGDCVQEEMADESMLFVGCNGFF